jgi:aspartate/methionine/tyrosine aminotransferase
LGAEDYINAALKVKSNIDSGMYKGLQSAAIAALNVEEFWHEQRNDIYAERRRGVFKILDYLGFEYSKDQEGMFVWAKPKAILGVDAITEYIDTLLFEKNIFMTPGFIFGKNGEEYIRLSLCVPASKVEEAYQRLLS